MEEGDGDGIGLLGKESDKMDGKVKALVVLDWNGEVWERVDLVLAGPPVVELVVSRCLRLVPSHVSRFYNLNDMRSCKSCIHQS